MCIHFTQLYKGETSYFKYFFVYIEVKLSKIQPSFNKVMVNTNHIFFVDIVICLKELTMN